MQDADDRGLKLTASSVDQNVSKNLEVLRSTNPNDPLFKFTADIIKNQLQRSEAEGLPTKFNVLNVSGEIRKIKNNNVRGFFKHL